MERKRRILKPTIICAFICILFLSGCGKGGKTGTESGQMAENETSAGQTAENKTGTDQAAENKTESGPTAGNGTGSGQPTAEKPENISMERIPMPGQVVPEGREVITLGTFGEVMKTSAMCEAVSAFNRFQEQYFVYIESYSSYRQFTMDVARKQGTDLYDLSWGCRADNLVNKGILEDLTPYVENSGAVDRELIVDSVWRAGSVDDKLYFVIPSFRCSGILVEKGYTRDGAWSGKDFLDLAKKYPGSMLNDSIKSPVSQLINSLLEYMGAFFDWRSMTCSFDSDEFISLLETLKDLADYKYEDVDENATPAEQLYGKVYLTKNVLICQDEGVLSYRNIVNTFGDDFEIAGLPSADGSLRYAMRYDQIYGMNAASEKKEGAWAFLEFLLSENYQQPNPPGILDKDEYEIVEEDSDSNITWIYGGSYMNTAFPARKDMLEKGLQANIDYVDEKDSYHINPYTGEREKGYAGFTGKDKQAVLRIIDNAYRPSYDTGDYTILIILQEETEPFFLGQKSAADVAEIIQSRMSLYLAE